MISTDDLIGRIDSKRLFLGDELADFLVEALRSPEMASAGVTLVTPHPKDRPPRIGRLRRSAVVQWFERFDGTWAYLVEWRPSIIGDGETSTHGIDDIPTEKQAIMAAGAHVGCLGGEII